MDPSNSPKLLVNVVCRDEPAVVDDELEYVISGIDDSLVLEMVFAEIALWIVEVSVGLVVEVVTDVKVVGEVVAIVVSFDEVIVDSEVEDVIVEVTIVVVEFEVDVIT